MISRLGELENRLAKKMGVVLVLGDGGNVTQVEGHGDGKERGDGKRIEMRRKFKQKRDVQYLGDARGRRERGSGGGTKKITREISKRDGFESPSRRNERTVRTYIRTNELFVPWKPNLSVRALPPHTTAYLHLYTSGYPPSLPQP